MSVESVVADIEFVSPLTDTVLQYFLKPKKYVDYIAGQYLQMVVDGEAYSYSIANAPLGAHHYELHIRHTRQNLNNNKVLDELKTNGQVQINVPLGDCSLDNLQADKPILFIAIGAGFAPIKAMIEQLFADSDPRKIKLYWGARVHSDLYMHDKIVNWQQSTQNFSYSPCLTSREEDSLITQIINENAADLCDHEIVLCGPFDLIYKMRDALLAEGVDKKHLFSDAFSFES